VFNRARPQARRAIVSRITRLGAATVAACLVAALAASQATAQTDNAPAGVEALRAQADDIANQYFQALTRARELESDIARNEQLVNDLEAKAKRARANARARAVIAYRMAGSELATFASGRDTLDAARRAHLIDTVDANDNAVYAKLKAATQDLRNQRHTLDVARTEQADALSQLQTEGRALDAKLAEAEQLQLAAEEAAAAATAPAPATSNPPAAPAAPASTTAPTTTTTPPPAAPSPPPNYQGTPGTNPHHDDQFLTCVRNRESGGNYAAVNPAGPYLGAYQFLQATWNGAANHDGRPDLVGVPPNIATPYDQDEMAWTVYQWQGMGPWGGACP
jgi:peptidoglycan hydrolase CwlO-like protein